MSKDFRASQIEVSKIILSGGIGPSGLGGLIYSGSVATNREGGIPASMLSNVGSDTMLFVSGVIGGKGTSGVVVFGGDVVASGSLTVSNSEYTMSSVFRKTSFHNSSFNVAAENHYMLITVNGTLTSSLPAAATTGAGRELIFKDISGNASSVTSLVIEISPGSGDKIDGASSLKIQTAYGSAKLISNGSDAYHIVGTN